MSKSTMKMATCQNPDCGGKFIQTSNNQRYCSKSCAQHAKYINRKLEDMKNKTCKWCGTHFITATGAKYCCKECAQMANKRRTARMKPRSKPKISLAEANEMARAEGLTYGQYFNRHGYGGYFGEV